MKKPLLLLVPLTISLLTSFVSVAASGSLNLSTSSSSLSLSTTVIKDTYAEEQAKEEAYAKAQAEGKAKEEALAQQQAEQERAEVNERARLQAESAAITKKREEEKAKVASAYRTQPEEEGRTKEERQQQAQSQAESDEQQGNSGLSNRGSLVTFTPTIDSDTPKTNTLTEDIPSETNVFRPAEGAGEHAADEMARNQQVEDANNTQGPLVGSNTQGIINPDKENPNEGITNPDEGRSGNEEDNEGFGYGRSMLGERINPGLIDAVIPAEGASSAGALLDPDEARPALKTPKLPGEDGDGNPEEQGPDPDPPVPGEQKGSATQLWIDLQNALNDIFNAGNPVSFDVDWVEYEGQINSEDEINNPNAGLIDGEDVADEDVVEFEGSYLIVRNEAEEEAKKAEEEAKRAAEERARAERAAAEASVNQGYAAGIEADRVANATEEARARAERAAESEAGDNNSNLSGNSQNSSPESHSGQQQSNNDSPSSQTQNTAAMYRAIGATNKSGEWVDESRLSRWQVKARYQLFEYEAGIITKDEADKSIREILDLEILKANLELIGFDGEYLDDALFNNKQGRAKSLILEYESGEITKKELQQLIKNLNDLEATKAVLGVYDINGDRINSVKINSRFIVDAVKLISRYEDGKILFDELRAALEGLRMENNDNISSNAGDDSD